MLRIPMPGPSRRRQQVPRAAAAERPHYIWQLVSDPPWTFRRTESWHILACRGRSEICTRLEAGGNFNVLCGTLALNALYTVRNVCETEWI